MKCNPTEHQPELPARLRDFKQAVGDITPGLGMIVEPKSEVATLWINDPDDNRRTAQVMWDNGTLKVTTWGIPVDLTTKGREQ